MQFNASSKEDIMELGLKRGSELFSLQLLSFQQKVDARLAAIEHRLDMMGRGDEDNGDGGNGGRKMDDVRL
jgi:hypothetical protein